jgi:hypothetical protein
MAGILIHGPMFIWKSLQQKNTSSRNLIRWTAFVITIAFITLAGTTTLAILSSMVSLPNRHFRIVSPSCGFYTDTSVPHYFKPAAGFQARWLNSSRVADEYVQTCYNISHATSSLCQQFVQQEIKWTPRSNAPCPFASGICLGGDSSAFEMDSGMIDSHATLGLNAARGNRVLYRRKTTCAPIITGEPYAKLVAGKYPGEEFALYYYGPLPGSDFTYHLSTYAQRGPSSYALRYLYILISLPLKLVG